MRSNGIAKVVRSLSCALQNPQQRNPEFASFKYDEAVKELGRKGGEGRHACHQSVDCALENASCISTLDRPREQEKRDAKVVKEVMRQIFISLKRLHGMGIVHRDVKPVRSEKAPLPLLGIPPLQVRKQRRPKVLWPGHCSLGD